MPVLLAAEDRLGNVLSIYQDYTWDVTGPSYTTAWRGAYQTPEDFKRDYGHMISGTTLWRIVQDNTATATVTQPLLKPGNTCGHYTMETLDTFTYGDFSTEAQEQALAAAIKANRKKAINTRKSWPTCNQGGTVEMTSSAKYFKAGQTFANIGFLCNKCGE